MEDARRAAAEQALAQVAAPVRAPDQADLRLIEELVQRQIAINDMLHKISDCIDDLDRRVSVLEGRQAAPPPEVPDSAAAPAVNENAASG